VIQDGGRGLSEWDTHGGRSRPDHADPEGIADLRQAGSATTRKVDLITEVVISEMF